MGDGFSELEQRVKGQAADLRPPPALCVLLLHLLLKPEPSSRLPPLQIVVLVNHQLFQLHKHLKQRHLS